MILDYTLDNRLNSNNYVLRLDKFTVSIGNS